MQVQDKLDYLLELLINTLIIKSKTFIYENTDILFM